MARYKNKDMVYYNTRGSNMGPNMMANPYMDSPMMTGPMMGSNPMMGNNPNQFMGGGYEFNQPHPMGFGNNANIDVTIGDFENRIARLERNIKRLDARLSRLENSYPEAKQYQSTQEYGENNHYDNSMHMV